jgi:hypothetical protein
VFNTLGESSERSLTAERSPVASLSHLPVTRVASAGGAELHLTRSQQLSVGGTARQRRDSGVIRSGAGAGAPQDLGGRGLRGRRQDHAGTGSDLAGDTRLALVGVGNGSGGGGGDYGAEVVGASLSVIWVHYGCYFAGVVRSFDARSGTHHVVYDDGDEEDIVLYAADVMWGGGSGGGRGAAAAAEGGVVVAVVTAAAAVAAVAGALLRGRLRGRSVRTPPSTGECTGTVAGGGGMCHSSTKTRKCTWVSTTWRRTPPGRTTA